MRVAALLEQRYRAGDDAAPTDASCAESQAAR